MLAILESIAPEVFSALEIGDMNWHDWARLGTLGFQKADKVEFQTSNFKAEAASVEKSGPRQGYVDTVCG